MTPDRLLFFFFFNDTATTEIYTLSLHDALPISRRPIGRGNRRHRWRDVVEEAAPFVEVDDEDRAPPGEALRYGRIDTVRSEEHTSELQSQSNLVCRLLLEKKKDTTTRSSRATPP